jgi:hypothetical protein
MSTDCRLCDRLSIFAVTRPSEGSKTFYPKGLGWFPFGLKQSNDLVHCLVHVLHSLELMELYYQTRCCLILGVRELQLIQSY